VQIVLYEPSLVEATILCQEKKNYETVKMHHLEITPVILFAINKFQYLMTIIGKNLLSHFEILPVIIVLHCSRITKFRYPG